MWLQGNYIIWKGQRMRRGKIPGAQGETLGPFPAPGKSPTRGKAACLLCLQASEASPAPPQNGQFMQNVKMRGAHFPGAVMPIPVAVRK